MRMTMKAIISAVLCAIMLSTLLAGCGKKSWTDDIIGTWIYITRDDDAYLRSKTVLIIKSNGTAIVEEYLIQGDETHLIWTHKGTWKAKDENTIENTISIVLYKILEDGTYGRRSEAELSYVNNTLFVAKYDGELCEPFRENQVFRKDA